VVVARVAKLAAARTGGVGVSKAFVHIQIPGDDARKNNERYLRAECEDARAETIHKAVAAMIEHPETYSIGCTKLTDWASVHRRGRSKKTPVVRGDEEERTKEQLDEMVATATG
jgi:hypothetical protein